MRDRIVRTVIMPSLAERPPVVVATTRGQVRIVPDGVRVPMTSDHLSRQPHLDVHNAVVGCVVAAVGIMDSLTQDDALLNICSTVPR